MPTILSRLTILGALLALALPVSGAIPTAETADQKALRAKKHALQLETLKLGVKLGYLSQEHADFMAARSAAQQKFRDENPEWVRFASKPRLQKRGGQDKRFNDRQRGDRNRGDDKRGGDRRDKRDKKDGKDKRQKLEKENDEMKAARGKRVENTITRLKESVAGGRITKEYVDFLVKRLQFDKAFRDSHPEWVKFRRPWTPWKPMLRNLKGQPIENKDGDDKQDEKKDENKKDDGDPGDADNNDKSDENKDGDKKDDKSDDKSDEKKDEKKDDGKDGDKKDDFDTDTLLDE